MLLRLARMHDLSGLMQFSAAIDSGMTSLPVDAKAWERKLAINEASAQANEPQPDGDIFLFLLEQDNQIVGTTAIYTGVGMSRPFYSYKLSTHVSRSDALDKVVKTQVLHLVNDFTGATELASLYLLPKYRDRYAGRFLSKSRFLLLHQFPKRFHQLIFAELRGWVDQSGRSPFWEALGEKFFKMPFSRADFVSSVNGTQFISDLMPKYPVYLDLLPLEAQRVLGQCNDATRPAKRLLEQEGFQWKGYVDVFDAGPTMQCDRQYIKIMQKIASGELAGEANAGELEPDFYMVSNGQLADYRIALTKLCRKDDRLYLPKSTLAQLKLEHGQQLEYLPLSLTS